MTKIEQPSTGAGTGGDDGGGGGSGRGPRHATRWWIAGLVAVVAVVALVAALVGVTVTSSTHPTTTTPAGGAVAASLTTAISTEQQAKATYDNVIDHLGAIRPFAAMSRAEAAHIVTLQRLAQRYGLALPAGSTSGRSSPSTPLAACQLGVSTEQHIVAMYTQLLTQVRGYGDLTRAFTNLQSAARDNHLPAFRACLSAAPPPVSVPGSAVTPGTSTASGTVSTSLATAFTAEQQARATYDNVIARFGAIRPFATVTAAETAHVDALQGLAQRYNVTLPTGPFTGQPSPATISDACDLGVTTEHHLVSMYAQLLTQVQGYADLTQAFTNFQAASRDSHLPAFEHCA